MKLNSICEKLKYAKNLWHWLDYYVYMQQWESARKQSKKIKRFTEQHPVINKIVKVLR